MRPLWSPLGAVLLLYIGGWGVAWNENVFFSAQSYILGDNGFLVKFNQHYYGLKFHARFFDSPLISWALLCAAFGITPFIFVPIGGGSSRAHIE